MLWECDLTQQVRVTTTEGLPWNISHSFHSPVQVCGPLQLTPGLVSLAPTVLALGSWVPATLGPLLSTSWLFGRHLPRLGKEIEPKDLIGLIFLVFLSGAALGKEGNVLGIEDQRFDC